MKAFRFINDNYIQLVQSELYEAHIEEFYVETDVRGKGIGHRLFNAMCKEADRESVTLYLTVLPYGTYDINKEEFFPPSLTYKQLCSFYREFGFRFEPGKERMKRLPKGD